MDDINFEELDKAVNSVLQKDASKPKAVKADHEDHETATSEPEAAPEAAREEVSATPARPQIVAPKRRGQFMDIVHPSSDMKTQPAMARPLVPSRQAATVQPLNPSIVETSVDAGATAEPDDHEDATPEVAQTPTETLTHELNVKPEWPDPLDVQSDAEEATGSETTPAETEEAVSGIENGFDTDGEDLPAVPEVIHETDEPTDQEEPKDEKEAGATPFIRSTEVEKRPLGAFADNPQDAENAGDMGNDPNATLPQELAPEVVSVEADGTGDMRMQESHESKDESSAVEPKAPKVIDTDEAPGHPVFDTQDYHQPLTPPAKKSHAGLIVLLIILLLAAAAAAGWYIATSMGVI